MTSSRSNILSEFGKTAWTAIGAHVYGWQYQGRQWMVGRLWRLCRPPGRLPINWVSHWPQQPRRVLLVIAGLIGDTIMSTPVIEEARRLWPDASIALLGRRLNCELLAACPLLDAQVEAPAIPFTLKEARRIAELTRWLLGQRFDIAIIALGDQFASVLAEVGIPIRV